MPDRTSAEELPHYSKAVERLNNRGGLFLGFAQHGSFAKPTMPPKDLLDRIPHNGMVFTEGASTDEPIISVTAPEYHPFLNAVIERATKQNAVVLPGGQSDDEIRQLLQRNDEVDVVAMISRLEMLQQRREMRAALGSLAWFMTFSDVHPYEGSSGVPVAIWGRTHASSLTDMYDHIGVAPINIKDYYNCGESFSLIEPHAHKWPEQQLQDEFARKLVIARHHLQ